MRTRRAYNGFRTVAVAACALGFMLSSGAVRAQDPNDPNAPAPQNKGQQKCIVEANKNVAKVIKAVNKDVTNCIKNGGKGKTEKMGNQPSIDVCTTLDVKGKVAKANGKLKTKVGAKCSAAEDGTPDFGTNTAGLPDPNGLNDIGGLALQLAEALFGSSLDAVIVKLNKVTDKQDVNPTNTKLEGKCQTSIIKNAGKCLDTKWKIYNKCKKNALKGKDGPPITDASGLEACVASTPGDPKVVKTCVTKLGEKMTKKCGEVDLDTAIPNAGAANPGEVATFVDARVECLFCRMANLADGLTVDCDLFDDGVTNDSCALIDLVCELDDDAFCVGGDNDGLECDDLIFPFTDCPGDAICLQDTNFIINTAPGGATIFQLPVSGDLSINCGGPDGNGNTFCTCGLSDVPPIDIGVIGFVCIVEASGCADGFIDCSGGSPVDAQIIATHDAGSSLKELDPNTYDIPSFPGTCGNPGVLQDPNTANEQCVVLCESFCALQDGDFEYFDSACEGFCDGGPFAGQDCDFDINCGIGQPGNCAGPEGNSAHNFLCECSCLEIDGPAAGPGGLVCEIGISTQVEASAPCDGTDISLTLGLQCVPLTTGTADATLLRAAVDPNAAPSVSPSRTGSAISCVDLAAGSSTGLLLAGNQAFYDSTVGDLVTPEIWECR